MKAMIVSDFAVLRSAILQLLGICAIIALFMGYAMGTWWEAPPPSPPCRRSCCCSPLPPPTSRTDGSASGSRCPSLAARWCSAATRASRSSPIGTIVFAISAVVSLLGVISCMPAGTLPEGLTPAENPPAALVGSVVGAVGVITLGMAVTLPLVFRFGMTRATRFVPSSW